MAHEYFCAYHSYLKNMNRLTDEECGKLFRALLEYSRTGEEPELDGKEGYVFDGIKENIRREKARYEEKCGAARENGKKGGRPKNEEGEEINPKNPVGFSKTQKTQEEEKEEDKEKDKEEDKEEDKEDKELSDDLRRYTTKVVTTEAATTEAADAEAAAADSAEASADTADAGLSEDAAEHLSQAPRGETTAPCGTMRAGLHDAALRPRRYVNKSTDVCARTASVNALSYALPYALPGYEYG